MLRSKRIFVEYPKLALLAVNCVVLAASFLALEGAARLIIHYDPGYYSGFSKTDTEISYPFGVIRINSLGDPDDEFDLEDPRPRIGYVGDSVVYGMGAGHGYRFSDLLEARHPEYQHMTLARVGTGFRSRRRVERMANRASELGLARLVYFLNLNDILPTIEEGPGATRTWSPGLQLFVFLRDTSDRIGERSYFINWLRYRFRVVILRLGYEYHGEPAYERFPERSSAVIKETAERVNALAEMLGEINVGFSVVVLPYEMQISSEAERIYASYGIEWEPAFIGGETQRRLRRNIRADIELFDATRAFVRRPEDREAIGVGEFFVFDRGDSLDWNHPNREGHRKIADFLDASGLVDGLEGLPASRAPDQEGRASS